MNMENNGKLEAVTLKKVISGVPFVGQKINAENYREKGFDSLKEAEYWSNRSCGAVCLEIALRAISPDSKISLQKIIEIGLKKGAHEERVGWIHQGLVDMAKEIGLFAGKESVGTDLIKIKNHLEKNEIVIASVSHGFDVGKVYKLDDGSDYVVPRGGHLIVIFGFSEENGKIKSFFVHHPSHYKSYEWENYELSAGDFLKSFSEKGNIIFVSKQNEEK